MAGPKQRGRGKKRTYAKKDPTKIRSWDEYWKERKEDTIDEEWDREQRLGTFDEGFFDYKGETDIPIGFWSGDRAIGKFESGKDYLPDMRDYRNTMSMQDIMGVPPSIVMSDPHHQAFREEGFDRYMQELIDREKRGIDWQKFRNQMNFKNMLIDPVETPDYVTRKTEQEKDNWGSYSPSTGIISLASDLFSEGNPEETVWHEYLHDRGLGERAVRDIIEQEIPSSGYSEEQLKELTDEEWGEVYRKLGATGPEDEPFRGFAGPPPKPKGKLRAILEGLGSFFKEKFN